MNSITVIREAMYVWRYFETLSCNHCCGGKSVSITYYESVFVASGIQHAMRMHHIIICAAWHYRIFQTFLTNGTILEKKLLNIKYVSTFSTKFVCTFFILRRTVRDLIINVCWPISKITVILVQYLWDLNFPYRFWILIKYKISWKSTHWEPTCSMRTD
jgi:hypothetical protein